MTRGGGVGPPVPPPTQSESIVSLSSDIPTFTPVVGVPQKVVSEYAGISAGFSLVSSMTSALPAHMPMNAIF